MARTVDEPEPQIEVEEMAGKVSEPKPQQNVEIEDEQIEGEPLTETAQEGEQIEGEPLNKEATSSEPPLPTASEPSPLNQTVETPDIPSTSTLNQTYPLQITYTDIPSTSSHEFFHIPPNMTEAQVKTLLKQILDQIALRPTTEIVAELACHIETEIHDDLRAKTNAIQDRLDEMVTGANSLSQNLGKGLTKKLRELIKTILEHMQAKDELFLSELAKHKRAVEAIHRTQQTTSKALIKQVFEVKDLIRQQNERSDNAMALVHYQQQKTDALLDHQRNDISASQAQMQELLSTVQHLTDSINDDNKGESTQRVSQSSSQRMSQRGRGRGDRGRTAGDRGELQETGGEPLKKGGEVKKRELLKKRGKISVNGLEVLQVVGHLAQDMLLRIKRKNYRGGMRRLE